MCVYFKKETVLKTQIRELKNKIVETQAQEQCNKQHVKFWHTMGLLINNLVCVVTIRFFYFFETYYM